MSEGTLRLFDLDPVNAGTYLCVGLQSDGKRSTGNVTLGHTLFTVIIVIGFVNNVHANNCSDK
jgi:hypothetical protein